ncbi:MAG TPA: PRC-barrel domain-containing protein [Xanthobacteraceae bacterium]|nr:PRC-barrel domain-containing protein [Xanthobacteraceae bacterium]
MPGKKLLIITAALAALALSLALTPVSPYAVGKAFSEDAQPPPASNQPAGTPAGAPQPATPPAAVTILNDHEVEGILGREVVSSAGENMGRVVDVLVDRSGQVRAAIIDFGGFLGVGSRKIAVDWNALHFPPPKKANAKITLELTRDQVKAAPQYQEGKPIVVLGALGKLEPLPE